MGDGWFVATEKSDYIQAIGLSSAKFQQSQDLYGSISKDMAYLFYALAVPCEILTLYFGKAPGPGAFR